MGSIHNTQKKGQVFNIQRFSLHDGPGIRTTVFLQGCPLDCRWCHNPEGKAMQSGKAVVKSTVRNYSSAALLEEIMKDRIFFEESGGGVTFSGGEPLVQWPFVKEMLGLCKEAGIHTAIDTSGYSPLKVIREMTNFAGLILFDIKLIDTIAHKRHTGKPNTIILRNLLFLLENRQPLRIRIPLIPYITTTPDNLHRLKTFLNRLPLSVPVDLLPYHRFAAGKFHKYHITNYLNDVPEPTEQEKNHILHYFSEAGIRIHLT